MNVELRLPPEWDVAVSADGSVRATSARHPELEILAAPWTHMIEARMEWARLILREHLGLPPGAGADQVKLRVDEKGTTADGWPSWFAVAERAGGAEPGEPRAFAFYYFLDYSSYAQIRGPGAAGHLDLLRRARPNYATDDVVALEELWK